MLPQRSTGTSDREASPGGTDACRPSLGLLVSERTYRRRARAFAAGVCRRRRTIPSRRARSAFAVRLPSRAAAATSALRAVSVTSAWPCTARSPTISGVAGALNGLGQTARTQGDFAEAVRYGGKRRGWRAHLQSIMASRHRSATSGLQLRCLGVPRKPTRCSCRAGGIPRTATSPRRGGCAQIPGHHRTTSRRGERSRSLCGPKHCASIASSSSPRAWADANRKLSPRSRCATGERSGGCESTRSPPTSAVSSDPRSSLRTSARTVKQP